MAQTSTHKSTTTDARGIHAEIEAHREAAIVEHGTEHVRTTGVTTSAVGQEDGSFEYVIETTWETFTPPPPPVLPEAAAAAIASGATVTATPPAPQPEVTATPPAAPANSGNKPA